MHIDLHAIVHWLSQPTLASFSVCVCLCLLPVLGAPLFPNVFGIALVRASILALWERERHIMDMRDLFESYGIITEPVTSHDSRCKRCKTGHAMTLECSSTAKHRPFKGVLTRCASCGQTHDLSPGETLVELAIRFELVP